MKIAYHTYAFGGRSWLPAWTIEEALRMTAEAGFDGLELAACRPHGWPADLNPARRRELVQLAATHGLAFSAVCLNQPNHNIASPVPE
jgi:sugar phosphate isomerase/epimerase